jgi:hypothetical protein
MANVMLADVEFLLDQAAEQQAALKLNATSLPWASPAWTTVTAYYWSFFSALALTRITGKSTWFLDKPALLELSALATVSTGRPGAGTLFFEIHPQKNNDSEIQLFGSGRNNHDAVWYCFARLIDRIFAATDQNASMDEYRLWRCLYKCIKLLGDGWPSEVRNDVNYKAGYAYREVMRLPKIKVAPELRKMSGQNLESLLSEFENEIHRVQNRPELQEDLHTRTKLMALNALLLSLVSESIHEDAPREQLLPAHLPSLPTLSSCCA